MIQGPARRRATVAPRGSTLIELMVVVVITGVLAAMAVPSFQRAVEQTRVDQAAATLRTIWAAQRFYRLEHGAYATKLVDLVEAELVEPELLQVDDPDQPYEYAMEADAGTGYLVTAARQGPGSIWSGTLSLEVSRHLDGEGVLREFKALSGEVRGHGRPLRPSFRFNTDTE